MVCNVREYKRDTLVVVCGMTNCATRPVSCDVAVMLDRSGRIEGGAPNAIDLRGDLTVTR